MKILEQALFVSERQIVLQSCDMMGRKAKDQICDRNFDNLRLYKKFQIYIEDFL